MTFRKKREMERTKTNGVQSTYTRIYISISKVQKKGEKEEEADWNQAAVSTGSFAALLV